jgi:hypothetical protein
MLQGNCFFVGRDLSRDEVGDYRGIYSASTLFGLPAEKARIANY